MESISNRATLSSFPSEKPFPIGFPFLAIASHETSWARSPSGSRLNWVIGRSSRAGGLNSWNTLRTTNRSSSLKSNFIRTCVAPRSSVTGMGVAGRPVATAARAESKIVENFMMIAVGERCLEEKSMLDILCNDRGLVCCTKMLAMMRCS